MTQSSPASTGISGLDNILNFLRMGDNVVWQFDSLDDYPLFVKPFIDQALRDKRRVIYIHFADHPPLLTDDTVTVHNLDAAVGFETFTTSVHSIIRDAGRDAFYVFDCLSNLLTAWATDLMIGNFFLVTCPYLFELNTIAYFAILRNHHSFKTIARIRETTQLFIDIYRASSRLYIHPLKVWNRYSPTMFLPHMQDGDSITPITTSVEAARLFTTITTQKGDRAARNLDYWDRLFLDVEEALRRRECSEEEMYTTLSSICRVMIAREERALALAEQYLALEDLVQVKSRLIGTGFIGGKAVGMLLARNILLSRDHDHWGRLLEPHDSFYIGSDVFYSYIVQNGWWKLRMEQKTSEGYFSAASLLREKLLTGRFPEEIQEQFKQMLEYFGQYPIIVRSSSLLEDSFGNAFAGKYDSFFLVNQGTPEERYENFVNAVRMIFSSSMNEDALTYRRQRGLENLDEQMAILVQRVSGSYHGRYFFPDMAGVGISHNAFVWQGDMDPSAGMLRLVLGLGTRAVERVDDDYPRIVALDMPLVKPHAGIEDSRQYSQRKVDVLNLETNTLETVSLRDLLRNDTGLRMDLLGTPDREITERLREMGKNEEAWILNFDELLTRTEFARTVQDMMKQLEDSYNYPVDMEFTANISAGGQLQINLLQCRPFQGRGSARIVAFPDNPEPDSVLISTNGGFMGGSIEQPIRRLITVNPEKYGALNEQGKYEVARLIGRLNKLTINRDNMAVMLLGPGRWGTTTPSLGVPVSFSEINNMSVLGEIAHPIAGLIPELSFGSHFFQDLMETGIFYLSVFPDRPGVTFNAGKLYSLPSITAELVPEMRDYADTVRVTDFVKPGPLLLADLKSQRLLCLER